MAIAPAPAKAKTKAKATKQPNSKKTTSAPRKPRAHPPYSEMINEAIMALKERTGSSQIAIAKFIEEKQKSNLPPNFKKLLLVQLKKLVANGKLVKVKNSFKLPPKTAASVSDVKAPAKPSEKKIKKKTTMPKLTTKKVAKSPAKKKAVAVSKKKTPVKVVKKPKTIKSPIKKVAVKKAKK